MYSMKAIQRNPRIAELSDCILNMLQVMDLSLFLFNTCGEPYSIPNESNYTAVFLSVTNEIQCIPLLCLSSRFMTYAPSVNVGYMYLA